MTQRKKKRHEEEIKSPYSRIRRVVRTPSDILDLFGEYEGMTDVEIGKVEGWLTEMRDSDGDNFDALHRSRLQAVMAVRKQREIALRMAK